MTTHLPPLTVLMMTDSSHTRLPAGHRLSELAWKATSFTPKGSKVKVQKAALLPNMCVAIPILPTVILADHVMTAFVAKSIETLQDTAIKAFIEAKFLENSAIMLSFLAIPQELTTYEGLAEHAIKTAANGRLSLAQISAWFQGTTTDGQPLTDTSPAAVLATALLAKGYQDERITLVVNSYANMFSKFSAPVIAILPNDMALIENLLQNVDEDTVTKRAILTRISNFRHSNTPEGLEDAFG